MGPLWLYLCVSHVIYIQMILIWMQWIIKRIYIGRLIACLEWLNQTQKNIFDELLLRFIGCQSRQEKKSFLFCITIDQITKESFCKYSNRNKKNRWIFSIFFRSSAQYLFTSYGHKWLNGTMGKLWEKKTTQKKKSDKCYKKRENFPILLQHIGRMVLCKGTHKIGKNDAKFNNCPLLNDTFEM